MSSVQEQLKPVWFITGCSSGFGLEFVRQLLIQEVPEVNDGTIVIDKIVRDAGYRTKLTVRSLDPKVDPVGACVGMRGNRVKNIVRELHNEKIDIICELSIGIANSFRFMESKSTKKKQSTSY